MKHMPVLIILITLLSSCSVQRQRTTVTGRTDDVYFTASDTRKKAVQESAYESGTSKPAQSYEGDAGSYTSSYTNRLRYFGSTSRFNYMSYQPVLVPSFNYNPWYGWNMGLSYIDPRFGYMSGFNSPFSPYFGYNMPFYDPFYSYGWGGGWMTHYMPVYSFNPYFYNPCSYYYGFGYGYYNPYYRNMFYRNYYNQPYSRPGQSRPVPYGRRTGTSTNIPSPRTKTAQPQNSVSPGTGSQPPTKKWYSGGNSDRNSGGSGRVNTGTSGSGGGNSDRGTSGKGGSTRRR